MCEPVLSVSACVKEDKQDNTTIAPFQIFDLSDAKYQLVIPYYDTESVNADYY